LSTNKQHSLSSIKRENLENHEPLLRTACDLHSSSPPSIWSPHPTAKHTSSVCVPPAYSQPHSIWHDVLHPSPGHKIAIVALVRRASRPLTKTASSLAAVDRPPAFQLPATCIQMRVPVVVPLGPLAPRPTSLPHRTCFLGTWRAF